MPELSPAAAPAALAAQVRELVDRLAVRYAAQPCAGEAERARGAYDAWRGRVFEDEELHATHVGLFLEWFVIERGAGAGLTPLLAALAAGELDAAAAPLARALAASYRSLFEVQGVDARGVLLVDLIGGGRWRLDGSAGPPLLDRGEILEARLIPWQRALALGPVALFHPAAAHGAIHALLARRRAQGGLGAPLVGQLAQMRLRFSRVRRIAVDRIYGP